MILHLGMLRLEGLAKKLLRHLQLSSIINYLCRIGLCLSTTLVVLALDSSLNSVPSFAAEEIVVRYGIFEQSLPVADLQEYGETNKVSSDLRFFLRFLNARDQQQFQQALQVRLFLDLVALDRVLDTELGQKFLASVSQAIARRDGAGIQALRAATILGAKSPAGLGIVSFLAAYPSKRLVIDLPQALELLNRSDLYPSSAELPPKDNLSSTALWQLEVQYQLLASQDKQYDACLFGDSITAELGNSLGNRTFNFALDGLSTISLVEQLKRLMPAHVTCQKTVIAIGGNDAWYGLSDQVFTEKLTMAIAIIRTLGTKEIFLIPAFYSTLRASLDPSLAAPLSRVDEINSLINQVAASEKLPVATAGIQPLYENNVLKDNLTTDGDHLNAAGVEIYRQALLKLLNSTN